MLEAISMLKWKMRIEILIFSVFALTKRLLWIEDSSCFYNSSLSSESECVAISLIN